MVQPHIKISEIAGDLEYESLMNIIFVLSV